MGGLLLTRTAIIVPDVHAFPGHIACDAASASEIVLPIVKQGRLLGVLDIDSPVKNRFQEADRVVLQRFVDILTDGIRWEMLLTQP